MSSTHKLLLAGVMSALFLSGCASKSTYYWGNYEQLIHDSYMEPGSADPVTQIDLLETDIQKAQSKGQPTPPGVHAHLGYMYSLQGNTSQAKTAFLQEKALYPESASFIDGMITRAYGDK
jgi:hypothetical protein